MKSPNSALSIFSHSADNEQVTLTQEIMLHIFVADLTVQHNRIIKSCWLKRGSSDGCALINQCMGVASST